MRVLLCHPDLTARFLFQNLNVWLGGLFIPEAYITATRQFVAQANNWSLEELYLDVSGKIPLGWCCIP